MKEVTKSNSLVIPEEITYSKFLPGLELEWGWELSGWLEFALDVNTT